ncbi:MAG: GNAT family protein, partial [Bacteroidota bacterium]
NYNQINKDDLSTELDILIADHQNQGHGLGTEAIQLLTQYLFDHMNVRRCRIEVISQNPRAIRAYEKAGYEHTYAYVREGISWNVMEILAETESVVDYSLEKSTSMKTYSFFV